MKLRRALLGESAQHGATAILTVALLGAGTYGVVNLETSGGHQPVASTATRVVGRTYHLILLDDLTMEDITSGPVGAARLHVDAGSSPYRCLNGVVINVFRLDGRLILHDGDQGPMCTYGTFELAPASVVSPGEVPMITATSPSPVAPGAVLTLAGRLLGTSGLVQLIGYGATSSGPIYRPGPVAYGPGRARVLLAASLPAGRYDVLVVTGGTGEPACGNGQEGVLGSATTASSRGCPSTGARVPGPRAPVDQYAGPRLGLPVDRRAGAGLGLPVDRSMRWSRTWGRRRSRWLQGDQTDAIEQRGDRPAPRRGCSQAPRRRRGFESQPHGASPRPECCSSRLALQSHS